MRSSQFRLAVGFVLAAMLVATPSAFGSDMSSRPSPIRASSNGKAIPNRYIIVLKEGANPRAVAAIAGVKPNHVYEAALNGFAAELNAGQVNALQHNPNVSYLEQDQAVEIGATQFMDSAGNPWGLDRIDQRTLPLSNSYSYNQAGAGVTAYIIDTGLQANHPDFGTRAQNVYDALGGNGVDCNGHGTHVAGTLGGATYGVAKQVQLRGVRVFGCSGGSAWSTIIAGIDWVRLNATRPAVANLSLSGGYSAAVDTAMVNLINSGVFAAVAAGNDYGADACGRSPASTAAAYTVAASDRNDQRASFSNVGPCVDIYAPGVAIKSAWIGSSTNTIDGTSMATPHVAGVAAIYKSTYGDASSATLSAWLSNNATAGVINNNPAGTINRLLHISPSPALSTPVPADYDGDGRADLSVKTDDGRWLIDYASNGFGLWDLGLPGYGDPSARPVPADYDGDGRADLSVKRDDEQWRIDYASNGFGLWDLGLPGYGGPSAQPVPADYDGDGRADLSVKRDDGQWRIDYASNGFGLWDLSVSGY